MARSFKKSIEILIIHEVSKHCEVDIQNPEI